MSANPTISGPARRVLDDRHRVTIDLKCVHCGYNVRTLRDQGRCPECGNTVAETVTLYRQQFDRRAWLRAACDGIAILLGGAGMVLPILLFASWAMISPGTLPEEFGLFGAFVMACGFCGAVMVLIGLGQISKRDPAEPELPAFVDSRSVLRACLWAMLLFPIPGSISLLFVWVGPVWSCAAFIYMAYLIVLPLAAFARIAELMRECEDEKTAAMAATLCITTAIFGGAVVVGALLGSPAPGLFEVNGRFLGVGLLLTTTATTVLLIRANRTSHAMIQRL